MVLPCCTLGSHQQACPLSKVSDHATRAYFQQRRQQRCLRLRARQSQNKPEGGGGGLDPLLERPVPPDQRPVNELASLRQAQLYSWATLDAQSYAIRFGLIWSGSFMLLGLPIALQTFDPLEQPLETILSAAVGGLVVVSAAVLRVYLGYAYVGNRLLTASLEYEETGWYDGQVFVKPPEVLARDRLLGSYTVRPILSRLKTTLLGSGVALALSFAGLFALSSLDPEGARQQLLPRQITSNGVIYSQAVKDISTLKDDDEAAAAEQLAQGGRPGYCGDRVVIRGKQQNAALSSPHEPITNSNHGLGL
ncbi:hypothetical protein WJX74_000205 [Apatococcus lobatus]|uniref:DUF1230-domain-containing protein n=1 Tax=Apatococcus lobatus TaxID=904363 RepID=A0AAW1R1N2_9CHLO